MNEEIKNDSQLALKDKIQKNKKIYMIILYVLLALTLIFHLGFSFIFIIASGRIFPNGFNLFYTTWKTSSDTLVGIPNFFIIPLLLILFAKLTYKLREY